MWFLLGSRVVTRQLCCCACQMKMGLNFVARFAKMATEMEQCFCQKWVCPFPKVFLWQQPLMTQSAPVCPLPRNHQRLIPNHPDAVNSDLIMATHTANDCYYMLKEFPLLSCFCCTAARWACLVWFPWQNGVSPCTSRRK